MHTTEYANRWRHNQVRSCGGRNHFLSRRTQLRLLMRPHNEIGDRYNRPNENEGATDWGYARHHLPSLWLPHLDQPTCGPYEKPGHQCEEA